MSELLFEGDIVRRVAKELGMEVGKIEHHMEFLKKFINGVVESEDVHSLHLPHLGVMYRNIKGCSHQNIHMSYLPTFEKKRPRFEKNERIIKNVLERLKTFKNLSLHNRRRRIVNAYFTCTMSKKELEEFQNHD